MSAKITSEDYRALAELRYQIRRFVSEGDAAARECGVDPQQYFLLLALRGLPDMEEPTVSALAERLALKHHSAVELIDRMEKNGYVHRIRCSDDRRVALVAMLPAGKAALEKVARKRITELRAGGAALVNAIDSLLGHGRQSGRRAGSKRIERNTKVDRE